MMSVQIFSGSCCLCDIGVPINEMDIFGRELFTGDIVQIWHGDYLGTDLEQWLPSAGLTAVVSNQYQSFSDGSIKMSESPLEFFVMGIKGAFIRKDPSWKVCIVKSHTDVIEGEKWINYGFSYKKAKLLTNHNNQQ